MRYVVNRMTIGDLPRVIEIERQAYPTSQWPASAYRRELQENALAHYIVARDTSVAAPPRDGDIATRRYFFTLFGPPRQSTPTEAELSAIIGYAGLWLMVDEAHVTTIATHLDARGRGVGELLLVSLIDIAFEIGARWVTLEVRVSNDIAQSLYQKYGFSIVSTRPRYYSDNNEDAYIMWTDEITTLAYRQFFAERKEVLFARMARDERVAENSARSEM